MTIAIVIIASPLAIRMYELRSNVPTTTVVLAKPVKVACVGDSITAVSGYPSVLQSMLGKNYTVGNFGSSGSTVTLNSWKPYMNQTAFQSAQNFEPNIVVIMLGTNDDLKSLHQYNESFEDDYAKLITSFENLQSNPQVYIADSPPIFNDSSDLSPAYLTNTIIPATEDLANRMNLPIINVYDAFGNSSSDFVDGVHPNSVGAALIATQVYDTIDSSDNSVQTPEPSN